MRCECMSVYNRETSSLQENHVGKQERGRKMVAWHRAKKNSETLLMEQEEKRENETTA